MDPGGFLRDIEAVPATLAALANRLRSSDPWEGLRDREQFLLTGMGSSFYAAQTAAGWLRSAGLSAVAELASQDPATPGGPGTTAVCVSAGGTSPETLDRRARLAPRTRTVALVNSDAAAPLATACDDIVHMDADPEKGGVACRTYRNSLALLLALGPSDVAGACDRAATASQALLDDRDWLDELDAALAGGPATFWIAPSGRIGSAWQSALMMRECPRTLGVGCETGDWSHVDVYLTKTLDYRAVVFTGSPWDEQAAEWMRQRESTVVSIGPTALAVPGERHVPLDLEPLSAMLTEPIAAELLAQRWWQRAVAS